MIRGARRELGSAGVDGLEGGAHSRCQARPSHVGLGDRARCSCRGGTGPARQQVGDLGVGEPQSLDRTPGATVDVPRSHTRPTHGFEARARPADDRQLVQEPRVDTGGRRQRVRGDAAAQRGLELEHATGRRRTRPRHELVVVQELVGRFGGVAVEPGATLLERANGLLQRLGEGPADGHHLADRLHPGSETVHGAGQLLEGPTRDLGHDIVDRGLEARRGGTGDVVGDLVEGVTDGETGRDLGDGKSGCLGRQRR